MSAVIKNNNFQICATPLKWWGMLFTVRILSPMSIGLWAALWATFFKFFLQGSGVWGWGWGGNGGVDFLGLFWCCFFFSFWGRFFSFSFGSTTLEDVYSLRQFYKKHRTAGFFSELVTILIELAFKDCPCM